jgi:hypothetical protein
LLAEYVDFAAGGGTAQAGGDATAQLKQGMKIDEVTNLFGQGKLISE